MRLESDSSTLHRFKVYRDSVPAQIPRHALFLFVNLNNVLCCNLYLVINNKIIQSLFVLARMHSLCGRQSTFVHSGQEHLLKCEKMNTSLALIQMSSIALMLCVNSVFCSFLSRYRKK